MTLSSYWTCRYFIKIESALLTPYVYIVILLLRILTTKRDLRLVYGSHNRSPVVRSMTETSISLMFRLPPTSLSNLIVPRLLTFPFFFSPPALLYYILY